ncbi:hypothetical protein [Streptomyces sp. NPDC046887]|uniref:hypothetical protein n=1 Tax=Streptomyces sp. NPDC046887 TaxID=3155472 RepID=UPI0033F2E374
MTVLMRAPRECGSWWWDLDGVTAPGLGPALATAARMADVLESGGLLEPASLEWSWWQMGKGGLGLHSRLDLAGRRIDAASVAGQAEACRPAGYPAAEMSSILVVGRGMWWDGKGNSRWEPGLVELTLSPDPVSSWAELAVYHDVWARYDFRGRPQPAVHARNAPRLAAALRGLDALLGVDGEPGEPTYFGTAVGHGLKVPDVIDGLGPNLTDLL